MFKLSLLALLLSLFCSCSSIMPKSDPIAVEDSEFTGDKDLASKILKVEGEGERTYLASELYLKGSDASLRGDADLASYYFQHLVKLLPEDNYLKKRYAIELIRTGDLKQAETYLKQIFSKGEMKRDEAVGLILGGVYTALAKVQMAQKVYRQVMKYNPQNEEACIFLAKSYAAESKFSKAHNLLARCEKRIKGTGIFAYYRGKLEISRKKNGMRFFKRALKIEPGFAQAVIAVGLLYEEKEQYDKAQALYQNYLKRYGDNYVILNRLMQLLFVAGEVNQIIPYAERLVTIDDSDLNMKVKLGILYTEASRFDDALGVFKEILEVMPDSDKVLYYLGTLCHQTGDFEEAIEYFSQVMKESVLFVDSNVQIAQLLYRLAQDEGEDSQAVKDFLSFTARQDFPEELKVELKIILAGYYEEQENFTQAVSEIEQVRTFKGYNDSHDYYLASLYDKLKNFERTKGILEGILSKNPDNADALNYLGYSLLEREQELDKALVYIKKAVKLRPDDGYIRDSLGWFYYKTGKLQQALVEVKKAWELVRTDVVISKHLAIIYQKLKKYSAAKKYFAEALKNCKEDSKERQDIIKALQRLEELRLPASVQK